MVIILNLPNLPRGQILPNPHFLSDAEKIMKDAKDKEQRLFQIKLEIFSCISGGIMGFLTSLFFWLISK